MKSHTLRLLYLCIGCLAVGLGVIGAFLPIMPTVPFLIVALWAFSKSSERFHSWLYHHKTYGPMLRDWDEYRVIPLWGKIWSSVAMFTSLSMMIFVERIPHWALLSTAIMMFFIGIYICSNPSKKPEGDQ